MVGGGQLWGPWPAGQGEDAAGRGWGDPTLTNFPNFPAGGSLIQRETWGGPLIITAY